MLTSVLFGESWIEKFDDIEITGIAYDSRKVQPGNVFVCIKGFGTDGHKYVDSALKNGAAVIVAEDQSFYNHNGFDFAELSRMKKDYDYYGKNLRGCSTISQQVAKNCFTFGTRTVLRKTVEAYYTTLIELFWSKERILEVYLNIAETGRGLFGVDAACNRYFACSSSDISISDAAALACVLPKPLARTPSLVLTHYANKHSKIAHQVGQNLSLNKQ